MSIQPIFQKKETSLMKSIQLYKKGLMDDMNLTLRLTCNNQTYTTKPVEWSEDMIIFEAPMSQLDYVIYPKNAKVQVVFVSKTALYISHLLICKSYHNKNSFYYVGQLTSPIVKKQQRESFRLEVVLDVIYKQLPQMDDVSSQQININELPAQKGLCINISVGGMCINTDVQLHSHDHLALTFTLVDKTMTLFGEVLFIGERTATGTYTHRIKFYGMTATEINLLNRLIFEKQRLMLKQH